MPRSSRHESSHRGHKHSSREARERSDSEEEGNSRERRSREESVAVAASGSRVSRDLEYEKRKGSSSAQVSQGKEGAGSENAEYSGDHGKKRKDRPAESGAAADKCNGGDGLDRLDERELRGEEVGHAELEGKAKVKALAVDSKGRSSRKHEGSSERKENSSGKDDSTKRRSEKEYNRRESSVHHKDVKDRERERGTERDREQGSERERERGTERDREQGSERERERGTERDRERGSDRDRESGVHRGRENWLEKEKDRGSDREKKIQDGKRERSSDASSRRQGGKAGSSVEEECLVKEEAENAELLVQDELHSSELEKEVEKRVHKRDDFRDKDKWQEDIPDGETNVSALLKNDKWQGEGRDGEDRRLSFREAHTKNGGYKDEYHRDGSHREKYRETVDRLQKHQDDKARDDRSSRDRNSDRSNTKHYRDEKGSSDNHYKRSKHQDSDHDGSPYTDDRGTKYKDGRGRKRPSNENDDHIDVKPRAKELCAGLERSASYNYNVDCSNDRDRPENVFPDKVDFSTRPKSSPSSSVQYSRDQYRYSSKQMEAMAGNSLAEERSHMASPGNSGTASVVHERVTEHRFLEKSKPKGERRVDELSVKSISSKYERSPRSDGPGSPVQLTEKSPSSTNERRRSNRASARRSLDVEEMGQRGSILKDTVSFATTENREQEQPKEKPVSDDRSQVDPVNNYSVPAGPSLNRPDNVSSSLPSHFPPPTRFGTDSPVLGSFDDDSRVLLGDRKSGPRYKRNMDFNMSRGQGNAWRGIQNWPSPVGNGFIPFPHLPPSGGFHPVVQQFPPPSLFGMRPSMDMSHPGVPYPMHEAPDRFSSHARPFGWRNPADDSCPPHLQGWDGSNGIPMDESHIYRRPDWDQSRHLLGSRGWEMSIDVWKGHNGNNNMDLPVPQKELDYPTNLPPDETWAGQSASQPPSEVARSPAQSNETKQLCETTPVKDAVEGSPKVSYEQTPEPSKPLKDDGAHFCRVYLSKLDISVDLVRPELYKQCMNLIGTVDGCSDVSKNHKQRIGGDAKVELKGSNPLNSHFPAIPDAVFQRAMSLYKAQNEEMKKKISQPLCKEGEKKDSSAEDKMVQDENLASEVAMQDVVNPPGNGDDSITTDAECIPAANPVEPPSDTIPTVVFVEDPQACEVLMPECRLNLSRIHHSSESTH